MIRSIIFDWGGVCCKEGEPFASLSFQKQVGLHPDEIAEKIRPLYNSYYSGKVTSQEFWNQVIEFFGLEKSEEISEHALLQAYLSSYEIYPEVFEIIEKLKKKYKIGLLSNLTPEMKNHIRQKHDLENVFDVEVYSCDPEVLSMKPSEKPYTVVLEKIGCLPEEALFIDNSRKNIDGGNNVGMQTLFFENKEQFLKDIQTYL